MPSTPLTVLDHTEGECRAIIMCDDDPRLIIRGTEDALDLACGQCGQVLVSGVSLSRFITIADVVKLEVRAFALDVGALVITDTLKLSEGVYVAGIQKPVLKCPACNSINDTHI